MKRHCVSIIHPSTHHRFSPRRITSLNCFAFATTTATASCADVTPSDDVRSNSGIGALHVHNITTHSVLNSSKLEHETVTASRFGLAQHVVSHVATNFQHRHTDFTQNAQRSPAAPANLPKLRCNTNHFAQCNVRSVIISNRAPTEPQRLHLPVRHVPADWSCMRSGLLPGMRAPDVVIQSPSDSPSGVIVGRPLPPPSARNTVISSRAQSTQQ